MFKNVFGAKKIIVEFLATNVSKKLHCWRILLYKMFEMTTIDIHRRFQSFYNDFLHDCQHQ